ncbi:MAG TPA: hypothetical protein PK771_03795 [Spirochaetota bacterium]|nr:hypothetical protein [Spirochaetota bacterium]
MEKGKIFQKEIDSIKQKFLEKKITETQLLDFLKNNLESNIYDLFDMLSDSGILLFISDISKINTSDIMLNRLINSIKNESLIFRIIKIIFESNFIHIKNYDMFYTNFSNFMFKIYDSTKMIQNFYMFVGFAFMTDNIIIKILFRRTLTENATLFREKMFSYSKNVFANMLNEFLNGKDKSLIITNKKNILNWDLWDYTQTTDDIRDFFNYLENQNDFLDTEIFSKMNEISNKTFKNFDINFENFKNNIILISDNLYEENVEIEIYFDNLNTFEKTVIKNVSESLLQIFQDNKVYSNKIKEKLLKLLIDDEFKKNVNLDLDDDSVSITPISDALDVYNENEKKLNPEDFDIEPSDFYPQNEIKKENTDTTNYITKNNEEEILKAAIEIVKEINNNFDPKEFIEEKIRIVEMVKDILNERKRINDELKLKKIIDKAIDEVLYEKDFEDL